MRKKKEEDNDALNLMVAPAGNQKKENKCASDEKDL